MKKDSSLAASPLRTNRPAATQSVSPSAHTPGPWVVRQGASTGMIYVTAPNSERDVVCEVGYASAISKDPLIPADARLIAAAPELLEALIVMLEPYVLAKDDEITSRQLARVRRARAAVSLATAN